MEITEEQKQLLQNTTFETGTNAWEYVLSSKQADQPWVVAGILSCMEKGYGLHEGQVNWETRELRYASPDAWNIKVLFLDFDGVMVTDRYQAQPETADHPIRDMFGATFDTECVENLRRIIDSTDARIVVTSTWKMTMGLDDLKQMWRRRNLPGEVIGITPDIAPIHRGDEIQAWLDVNPNAVRYAIIDDCPILDFFREDQLQFLFKVDERTGLDEETANKIIEHLRYT